QRVDDLMLGRVVHDGLFFQRDADTGRYEDLTYGKGYEGPSLAYRKIEKLERDSLFRAWIENPTFERVARAVLPGEIAIYRAMVMNRPASGGTLLPWHQDAGLFWGIDRDPQLQLWTALDDAPEGGGCIEVLPGSHIGGLVTPTGGVVPQHAVEAAQAENRAL